MTYQFQNRREFLNLTKLSVAFLLTSCGLNSRKFNLGIQSKFYPDAFLKSLPKNWIRNNINFSDLDVNNNYEKSELLIINDGWLNSINFERFKNLENNFNNKLDSRAEVFLDSIPIENRNKLIPIGVIPYVVVIKNNRDLKISADQTWDFLLSENLKNKIIVPNSPRLLISIAERMKTDNALPKLISQVHSFDEKNALNWLINSDISIAIMPYSICYESIKIDSRLSFLFPEDGVPLIWNFILTRSELHQDQIHNWINSFNDQIILSRLSSQGFFLPFVFESNNDIFGEGQFFSKSSDLLSTKCWQNSWSLLMLEENEKQELEKLWKTSSTP